jgi:ABC-2 type transport system ATP-binding protein
MTLTVPVPAPPLTGGGAGTAVATTALSKRFGGHLAVDRVDLNVPAGSIYGLLGPNGSGKTTTLRMLLGLVRPTGGTVELLGAREPVDALPHVGALIEGPGFLPHLTGRANLLRLDRADARADRRSRRERIGAALARVSLGAAADRRYRTYSLGMKQRLGIAAALLRPRALLVLDEPTNGLDPQGIRALRVLIRELAAEGVTVLVSSHLLAEAAQFCTDLGVMKGGRLIWQGPVADFAARSLDAPTGGPEAVLAARLEDAYICLTGAGFDVHD